MKSLFVFIYHLVTVLIRIRKGNIGRIKDRKKFMNRVRRIKKGRERDCAMQSKKDYYKKEINKKRWDSDTENEKKKSKNMKYKEWIRKTLRAKER